MAIAARIPLEHLTAKIVHLPAGGRYDFLDPVNKSQTVRLVDIKHSKRGSRTVAILGASEKPSDVIVVIEDEGVFKPSEAISRQLSKIYREQTK